uniref:SKP1 component POZ domain-containing protein n=1 Tax=Castor canadensis TaxID=51338 RepID=A0A8C0WLH1_CASCN
MPSIKLQSSDGEIFEVDVEIAKQSVTIKTMLEDLGMDDEGDDDPVPLPNKRSFWARQQILHVIPAPQKIEIGRVVVQGHPGQNVCETPISTNKPL